MLHRFQNLGASTREGKEKAGLPLPMIDAPTTTMTKRYIISELLKFFLNLKEKIDNSEPTESPRQYDATKCYIKYKSKRTKKSS